MRKFSWKYWLGILVFIFPMFELIVRLTGGSPFENKAYKTEVTPENAYVGNDSLGIELSPGTYDVVVNDSLNFSVTHTQNKRRLIYRNKSNYEASRKVAMLGCSFTYGYGVDDGKEFSSLINLKDSTLEVSNYGVIGYGTVQSLLQLPVILKDEPKLVILNLSSFHLMRNVLNVKYRQSLKLGYARSRDEHSSMKLARFPFVKDTSLSIHFEPWSDLYKNWTGRETFAAINWLQSTFEKFGIQNKENPKLTFAVIKKMNGMCNAKGVDFAVANIDNSEGTNEIQSLCETLGINWMNQNFDFSNEELTNLPYDSHPNEQGHVYLANKLLKLIYKIK